MWTMYFGVAPKGCAKTDHRRYNCEWNATHKPVFLTEENMTKKYDYVEEEDDDDEDDGFTKERRKRRIKTNKKFKKRWVVSPKRIKGFVSDKPRRRDWRELMDDEKYDKYFLSSNSEEEQDG